MLQHVRYDDPRLNATEAALVSYAWRRLSTEMLARHVVAALDRHCVNQELARVCGALDRATAGDPVDPADDRVAVLTQSLRGCCWSSFTLSALCRYAIAALDSWQHRREWLDIELSWLLSGH